MLTGGVTGQEAVFQRRGGAAGVLQGSMLVIDALWAKNRFCSGFEARLRADGPTWSRQSPCEPGFADSHPDPVPAPGGSRTVIYPVHNHSISTDVLFRIGLRCISPLTAPNPVWRDKIHSILFEI